MNILVTGASGFVGRYLCKHLDQAGHHVIAVARPGSLPIEGAKVEKIASNFDDFNFVEDVLPGCDVVIHLAGRAHILKDTSEDPLNEFRRVNVEITEKLILKAAKCGVRRFIFISSIGVNGNRNSGHPFTENDVENPHDLYAISKIEAEQAVRKIAEQSGMEYIIIRPVLIYGPNAPGNFGLLLKLAFKRLPLPFLYLSAKRSLLSVWNLVDFLTVCVNYKNFIRETFLIADEQTTDLAGIFRSLGEGMGKKQIIFPFPTKILIAICSLFHKKHLYDKLNSELVVDVNKAKNMLNWNPPYSTPEALIKTGKEYIWTE
ncbi:MAG: NAD-dependent epimerase/dehydratase family protein [Collimonas pratensis]